MRTRRSRTYPAIDLAEATRILLEKMTDLDVGLKSRDEVGVYLGYRNGSGGNVVRKISALVQYGFLEREGGQFKLSRLGHDIIEESEVMAGGGVKELLQEAFKNPSIFGEILGEYGHLSRMPADLPRILEDNHGITAKVSREVSSTLMSSAVFAGLIDRDGYFKRGEDVDLSEKLSFTLAGIEAPEAEKSSRRRRLQRHLEEFDTLLDNGRKATVALSVPIDFNEDDIKDLVDQLGFKLKYLVKHLQRRPIPASNVTAFGKAAK